SFFNTNFIIIQILNLNSEEINAKGKNFD
ncbi:uncharacterized protein METZ01_LOCUS136993, partial [marine metagenome]